VVIAVVVVVVACLVTVMAPHEAAAGELEAFGSCDELAAWEPAGGLGLAGGGREGTADDAGGRAAAPKSFTAAPVVRDPRADGSAPGRPSGTQAETPR
jgi:hypothetical protein